LQWLRHHRGLTEDPPGSNTDSRSDGIHAAQRRCANGGTWLDRQPWCGVWAWNAAHAGGVKCNSRWASVALIEDDARAGVNGFKHWTTDPKRVMRADLVVLFGRGVHVETVRRIFPRLGWMYTDGGNTSSGNSGSQSNGGGSFRRMRRISDAHGFAVVNYPGGPS